jgi:hypothetical protein
MTRSELIASRLKSLAHNPDHPDSILPQVPWSDYGTILPVLTEDSIIIMDCDTYKKFLRPSAPLTPLPREMICIPCPMWYP